MACESYPLDTTTDGDLEDLSRTLWGWHDCSSAPDSQNGKKADADTTCIGDCPWGRHSKLSSFHTLYRKVVSSYVPDLDYGCSPALRDHQDLRDIIKALKERPDVSRSQLISDYFGDRCKSDPADTPSLADQERAFSLAAWIMTGVACSGDDVEIAVLELGTEPVPWRGETSISQFLMAAFPLSSNLSVTPSPGAAAGEDTKLRWSAERITKVGHLSLQSTNDIRRHLELDSKMGTLLIYQQQTLLKEHLRATQHSPREATISEMIKVGNIPRQLALEVLDSLNNLLFPPMSKSYSTLRALVAKDVFDKDMLQLESRELRQPHEVKGEFHYLASKLRDLQEEIENPTPRGVFEKWFERRIAQRYFMMATLGGLLVAIFLGLLGLGVGIFQSWVAYMAWKHPEGDSST